MSSDGQLNPLSPQKDSQSDEIEISQILLILWSHRRWIAACTLIFALGGVVNSYLVTPQYSAQATLALKEPGKGGGASSIFSQFGGVGGAVASQLGVGNTNISKMEIILKSEELAEAVIKANDLMPILYYKLWDSARGDWKSRDPKKIPLVRKGAIMLSGGIVLVATDEKKGIIKIAARMRDPDQAKKVVDGYLVEINRRIRLNVTTDADSNRGYLERQLNNTSDPVLIEKIQSLIALEIEKTMLISSSAFEVLESPRVPLERVYPKRKIMVAVFFMVGLVLSIASIFVWKGLVAFRVLVGDAGRPGGLRG